MKNILFINPPNDPFSSRGILIEPIDNIHLSSYIKSLGYNVSFLDMDVKKLSPDYLYAYLKDKNFDMGVVVFDYHIPLHDEGSNQKIFKILQILKEFNIVSTLGGKIASFYSEEQLKNWHADFFLYRDIEHSLKLLLEQYPHTDNIPNIRIKKNGHLIKNIIQDIPIDLNSFPIPDRTLCDLEDYIDVRTILSSRGCNLKCTFCHVPGFWGNWKGKSPELVVEEILYLQNSFQAKKILFLDDNATAQPQRMKKIAELLIEKQSKVALGCLGTIISFKEEVMQKMFEAGFRWIHYGAESADENMLISMNKKTNPEHMLQVIKKTQEIGFRVRTSWILDMPGLTEEALLKTEKMIIENPTQEIRLHFLSLRLGSFLYNKFHIDTKQFIHNPKQNINISGIESQLIEESVARIISSLQQQGYILVCNPEDFINVQSLQEKTPDLKIVSLCPLRYGLGWKYETV